MGPIPQGEAKVSGVMFNIVLQKAGFSAMDFHLVIGGIISALTLLIGHYFPWHKILPSGQPLDRIWSYRYGSGACWAGFAYWRFSKKDRIAPLGLMAIYAIAGMTVSLAYWLDAKGQDRTVANRVKKASPAGVAEVV